MLVLTRKLNESIIISDTIEVKIVEIRGDQVKLGIVAPRDIAIYRKELYEKICQANLDSAMTKDMNIPVLLKDLKGGESKK